MYSSLSTLHYALRGRCYGTVGAPVRCSVLFGAVRCGRCGTVRFGSDRKSAERFARVRSGSHECALTRRFNTESAPPVRCSAVRCGPVRYGTVRCGAVRLGSVRIGRFAPHFSHGTNTTVDSRSKRPDDKDNERPSRVFLQYVV